MPIGRVLTLPIGFLFCNSIRLLLFNYKKMVYNKNTIMNVFINSIIHEIRTSIKQKAFIEFSYKSLNVINILYIKGENEIW